MATVVDIFNHLGLNPWWKASDTKDFDGGSELGTDYALPGGSWGQKVGSISKGTVVYVGDGGLGGSAVGQIVQVLSDDGSLLHYQHLKDSSVYKGQRVEVGTVVGTEGGCPVGAYIPGGACSRFDQYSTGPHIEVRYSPSYVASKGVWNQQWTPPLSYFARVGNSDAGAPSVLLTTGSGTSSDSNATPTNPFVGLGKTVSVWAEKSGIFILGAVFVIFGVYMLFGDQIKAAASSAEGAVGKTAVKAALL